MSTSADARPSAAPASGLYYLEGLSPLFLHPEVRRLDEARRRELLVLHLYAYLEFTVRLERGPVSEAIDRIDRGEGLPWLPDRVRSEARRIGEEERAHGEMYEQLAEAVEEATGVAPPRGVEPAFLGRLSAIQDRAGPRLAPWVGLFFVVVSETLVTGDLRRLRKDPRVVPAVRAVVGAHARDEARHHAFFSELCEVLWPRIDPETRRPLGATLPDLLGAYLAPDRGALRAMLARWPDAFPDPDRVAAEGAALAGPLDERTRAAAPSVGAFRRSGVLDDPAIARAFADAGWTRPARGATAALTT